MPQRTSSMGVLPRQHPSWFHPDPGKSDSPVPLVERSTLMVATKEEDLVMVAVKTPLMPRALSARMSGRLTMAETLAELHKTPDRDANSRRVKQQLERETSSTHDYLVFTEAGEVIKKDPQKTTLRDIAIEREVKTPRGIETIPTAAFEVQAYAPVGA
jgi:hypothetical protein